MLGMCKSAPVEKILCSLVMAYHSVAKLYIIFELRKIFAFKMKLFFKVRLPAWAIYLNLWSFEANGYFGVGCCEQAVIPLHAKAFLLSIHFKNYSSMKHFTLNELTRSTTATLQGIDNTPPAEAVHRLELLVEHVLDPLREAWGKPIHVSSGYRCPALNKAVGGAPASQHMRGEAADISVGNPADNRRLYHLLHTLKLPVDQAINEYDFSWIHVSYGPRMRRQYIAIR